MKKIILMAAVIGLTPGSVRSTDIYEAAQVGCFAFSTLVTLTVGAVSAMRSAKGEESDGLTECGIVVAAYFGAAIASFTLDKMKEAARLAALKGS